MEQKIVMVWTVQLLQRDTLQQQPECALHPRRLPVHSFDTDEMMPCPDMSRTWKEFGDSIA